MKFDPNKDYYLILGVDPTASIDEITKAYKARTKILHPDRFDRGTQAPQWEEANEMQTDLNLAFQVLRDPRTRGLFNEYKGYRFKSQPTKQAGRDEHAHRATASSTKRGVRPNFTNFTEALFNDLPQKVKKILERRQIEDSTDQIRVSLKNMHGAYTGLCGLGILLVGFFLKTSISQYNDAWWLALGLMWVGAYLCAVGIKKTKKANCSVLKPNFYLTPLHIIKTSYDSVCIWPLIDIKEVEFRDQFHNGVFYMRKAYFSFKNRTEIISIKNIFQAEEFVLKYHHYKDAWNQAVRKSDHQYFEKNNDLKDIEPEKLPVFKKPNNQWWDHEKLDTFMYSFGVAFMLFVITWVPTQTGKVEKNKLRVTAPSQQISKPQTVYKQEVKEVSKTNTKEEFQKWEKYTQDPKWKELTTEQKQSLFDDWVKYATEYLEVSGALTKEEDREYMRKYMSAAAEAENLKQPELSLPPIEKTMPQNGSVQRVATSLPQAPFKVDNRQGDDALIKLVDPRTGAEIMTMFVRAGSIAETEVPLGQFEARYATGQKWYGYEKLFGSETLFSKVDRNLKFYEDTNYEGTTVHGCSVTLYKVRYGNLSTSRINASQF